MANRSAQLYLPPLLYADVDGLQSATQRTHVLDATTDGIEYIMQAPAALAINQVKIYVSNRTGTQPTYRVSLQGYTPSTQRADGTIKASGLAYGDVTPSANGWVTVPLGATYTPAVGEHVAVVISYLSGTIGASNNTTFGVGLSANYQAADAAFYWTINSGTASVQTGGPPMVAWSDGTNWDGYGLTGTVKTVSSTLEVAMRFVAPFSATLRGLRLPATIGTSGVPVITLYQGGAVSDTTPLVAESFSGQAVRYFLPFSSPPSVTEGVTYRLSLKLTSGTLNLLRGDFASQADMEGHPLGTNWSYSERSGGDWTDSSLSRFLVSPVFTDLYTGPTPADVAAACWSWGNRALNA